MLTFKLPAPEQFKALHRSIEFDEHCLYTERVQARYVMPEHDSSLGIIHSIHGHNSVKVNGVKKNVDENSFLLVNQNSRLSLTSQEGQPVLLYFQFGTPELVASSLYNSVQKLMDDPFHSDVNFSLLERVHFANTSLRARLKLLTTLPESCSSFQALKTDSVVRSIIEELLIANMAANTDALQLNVVKKSTRTEIYKRLLTAKEWMEANFDRPITLIEISQAAHLNSQHFLRLFKQLFHKTPHQHLIDIRIEKARQLIINSDFTISEVCRTVGWESLASFSNTFKKKIGLSPFHLRKTKQ